MDDGTNPEIFGISLKDQIVKLAVIQYLIWLKERPEGINWQAVELSFCYHLLNLPFSQKLSRFTLGVMQVMLKHLIKKYNLPKEIEGLKALEKAFCLEIDGKSFPASDCSSINSLLSSAQSNLRLCSGFYGSHRFYILGEAEEKKLKNYIVYRFKKELAVTPGCHLLMAALVGGKNIFLRESSARFLFYQKWRNCLKEDKFSLSDEIKRFTLKQFEIKEEKDFKENSKGLISSFTNSLFQHELNHCSIESYINDKELIAIAQASSVLEGPNLLSHLLEIFTDWLPGRETKSPLLSIFEGEKLPRLSLYITDNWFYDSSFPEMEMFSRLNLLPIFRHFNKDGFNWNGLISEVKHFNNGSLLSYYVRFFEEICRELKKIAEESSFVLTYRPVSFEVISAYVEKDAGKCSEEEYLVSYWSKIFNYLKKFSKSDYQKALDCLARAEERMEKEISHKIGGIDQELDQVVLSKAREMAANG